MIDLVELRRKAEAADAVAPSEWELDRERMTDAPDKHHEFFVIDGNGNRMFGTENADASFGLIDLEDDGDGFVAAWNENSRRVIEFTVSVQPRTILALLAEIDRCHARLEIDRVWHATTGGDVPKRVSYAERNTIPDGIECRDETIKMQDERIKALEAKVAAARNAALDEAERTVARCEDEFEAAAAIRDLKEETK